MAIHKFSLIAEFEFEDEDGEYTPPKTTEIERRIHNDFYRGIEYLGLKETHLEIAKGDLHTAFGIEEL